MKIDKYLDDLKAGYNLKQAAAEELLGYILDDDKIQDQKVAQMLSSLNEKGETIDEILGFIDAMRARMIRLDHDAKAIDVCGTGGDKSGTFNISTAAAMILAASGVSVAKHGNRSASSKFGSADVLESLLIPIDREPAYDKRMLEKHGFVFLFAQKYHPALKRLAIVRKSLGFPTVFNLLGPLLNPAGVRRQVIGTFNPANARKLADIVARLEYEHAIVLTSEDGLDEASLAAPTQIIEIRGKSQKRYKITPKQFDLATAELEELQEGDAAAENAQIIIDTLKPSDNLNARQRVVVLNAALGLYVSGQAKTIDEGVFLASQAIKSGRAAKKLKELQL